MWRYLPRVVRARPIVSVLVLVLVLLVAAGITAQAYALYQWRAAENDLRADRAGEARRRLATCLTLWPSSVPVQLRAARAARLTGDFESAEAHLNRCLKLEKGATEPIQLEFLLLRVQRGEVDEVASALLGLVDENHAQTPLILETLARFYMHHLRFHEAYACLTRWIEETPDEAKPYHWRGWVYERLSNHRRALQDYQKALELDPELVPVRLRVAEMFLEDNNPQQALPHLERLLRTQPDRAQFKARLGQCRLLQGRLDEARPLLEEAVETMPNDPPLLVHLGRLELQQKQPVKAEHWLRRVLDIDPTDTEALYALVASLQMQRRKAEAEATLERYKKHKALLEQSNRLLKEEAERPSTDPARPYDIGNVLLRLGQHRLALYWLHEALRRDRRFEPAHRLLAEHYEQKGETEKAAAHRRYLSSPEAKKSAP